MKTRFLFVVLLTTLSLTVAYDNPVVPAYLSELAFSPGGDWTMEMRLFTTENLIGWVASRTDTAYFKGGITAGPGFFVFTKDSLKTPLLFNRTGDRISLVTQFGEAGSLTYGSLQNSEVTAPRDGQSISRTEDFYYLDNTPTLGSQNDTINAMGNIDGLVTDTAGVSLKGVSVTRNDWTGKWWTTDSLGRFTIHDYAKQQTLLFSLPGYNTQQILVQAFPDSVVTIAAKMTIVVTVDQSSKTIPEEVQLLSNYPNPFNPTTTIRYVLPSAMEVLVTVFDMQGRSIAVLVNGRKEAGLHQATFDGSALPSGIYLSRLQARSTGGGQIEQFMGTNKFVLLK